MKKMTVVKYFEPDGNAINISTIFVKSATGSKVVYENPLTGDQIVILGKNLKMDHGVIDSGTMTKISIIDGDGGPFQIHSGFHIDASNVFGQKPSDFALAALATAQLQNTRHIGSDVGDSLTAFSGNDIVLGRGGDDNISGGRGNDRLTGGDGNDSFDFSVAGLGKDIITDFDADGGIGNQDHIHAVFADATVTQVGANTVLDFGNGDVLTLLNVNTSQIAADDFL